MDGRFGMRLPTPNENEGSSRLRLAACGPIEEMIAAAVLSWCNERCDEWAAEAGLPRNEKIGAFDCRIAVALPVALPPAPLHSVM